MQETSTTIAPKTAITPFGRISAEPRLDLDCLAAEMTTWESALPLIYALCQRLHNEQIGYCHWKSNDVLERSATGENDLDLLIRRTDMVRFTQILATLGFKQAEDSAADKMPGVLDYYGYDKVADRFVHVHAHVQLILGQDLTKNYHLPLEEAYLASATQEGIFMVPAPDLELIVLAIRAIIKYGTWDVIAGRVGSPSKAVYRELAFLESRADRAKVYANLRQYLPFIGVELFELCMKALQPGAGVWTRLRAGHRLQRQLRACMRRPYFANLALMQWRRLARAYARRLTKQKAGKRLSAGGALIAIVGGDGSGKTTSLDELEAWLSQEFDTIRLHMGKPTWSLATHIVRGVLKLGRMAGLAPWVEFESIRYCTNDNLAAFPGYPLLIREVCAARDRYLTYQRAQRHVINGGIAICDRFPLRLIEMMDGAQVAHLAGPRRNPVVNALAQLEKRFYQLIVEPNVLIILRLDPEIAVQRRSDENPVAVRMRNREIFGLDWRQTDAHVIDASLPRQRVRAALKSVVWSQL